MRTAERATAPDERSDRGLPLPALLALATAVLITSLTETLPAGLLPAMSASLHAGESATGQTVTIYAIGAALGWQAAFLTMTGLTVVLLGWIRVSVPDFPGRRAGERTGGQNVLRVPGVAAVLFVTLVFVLAHTILYTYIAAILDGLGMGSSTDLVLLAFGAASLAGIWVVGAHIHRRPRALMIAGTLLVAAAAAVLALWADAPLLVYAAVVLWGLGWGGAPTLLQTAAGDAGGEAAPPAPTDSRRTADLSQHR
ncbi:MFS transporter [Actinomadura luteofluorescens]|uniref:MFS transporter n=1 Tax=Actinomadura luteofluorescens TaxID=46163 RepID=UPI00347A1F38